MMDNRGQRLDSGPLWALSIVGTAIVVGAMAFNLFGPDSPISQSATGSALPPTWYLSLLSIPVLALLGTVAGLYLWFGGNHGR